MRDIATSIQILTGCIASVIVLSIAVSAPLLKLGNIYELHLFPRDDAIEYDTSKIHRTSQVTHCLAIVFFALAMLLSIGAASIFATRSALQQKRIATVFATFTALGTALHWIALATLIKMALDWKHKFERLPVPLPDVHVAFQGGLYADFLGFMITFGTAIIALMSAFRLRRVSYVQLQ